MNDLIKTKINIVDDPIQKLPSIDFTILDGLRGIAAVYVVFNHARGNLFIGGVKYAQIKNMSLWSMSEKLYFSALQCTALGREFVILFFILSGFSIAFSLNGKPKVTGFYIRRLIRIYPPYLIALIWAFVVFMVIQTFMPIALPKNVSSVFNSFGSAVKNIFYMDNGYPIAQFWSLKFEVIFYLFIPFFILQRNLYFVVSFILEIIALYINWKDVSGGGIFAQYILDYNIYFAIGVFCYFNYEKIKSLFILKNKFHFYAIAIFLFFVMIVFKFLIKYDQNKYSLVIASLFSILLLFNFLHHKIKNNLLLFFGKISYTIYITHFASLILLVAIFIKLGVVDSIEIKNKFLWLAGIPFAVGISYLFYLLVEKPSKDLLIKLRKKN